VTDQPRRHDNPLDGVERLLVDGSNFLHALRRGLPAAPPATLIGRLRGVIEMPVRIEIMFDGPPDQGLGRDRIAAGVTVRYSGRASADAALQRLVVEAAEPATLLVVTDDVDLRHEVTRRGAKTAGNRWLMARLDRARLQSPSVGRPRPAVPPPPSAAEEAAAELRPGWRPGRGATTKRGNPRRTPRR
jgi:predicted RNA-binding protein with PIN domain